MACDLLSYKPTPCSMFVEQEDIFLAVNKKKQTFLHIAAAHLTGEEVTSLTLSIPSGTLKQLCQMEDGEGNTPAIHLPEIPQNSIVSHSNSCVYPKMLHIHLYMCICNIVMYVSLIAYM